MTLLDGRVPETVDEYEDLLCDYAEQDVKLWAIGERLRETERRGAYLRIIR
jgi:hypothetical protein